MTFTQYWAILIKQWKIIVACFVIVGLGSFIVSKHLTPLYQSSALVEVAIRSTNNQADYNSLLASDQLVQTEAQLATSDPVIREVASHYNGTSPDQILKRVSATVKTNTQLFEIDVLDPNPKQAATIANDVASTLINQQLQVTQQDNNRAQLQTKQDLTTTSQQIDTLTNKIATLQAAGGKQAQIAVLQAQLNGLQQHYNQWQTVLAQLELTQAQSEDLLRVLQFAQPAVKPVQPNVLLNTGIGLAAGLLLGILLAFASAQFDTRVRTAEELSQVTDWSVLATIWRVPSAKRKVLLNPSGQNSNSEAYRILRTNIGFSGIDKQLRSLLITSAVPREGKSTITANLAIFLAKAGRNTLLIDADLHRPFQHELFDLPADKMGLSNAILALGMSSSTSVPASQAASTLVSTGVTLDPFVHSVGIPHLWVMPSGPLPPNPSELLDSKSMQRLLTVITNSNFDMVIFDGPPSLGLADASILASKVDGTLIVADISRSRKGTVRQLKKVMGLTGTHVLGCVVNKQRRNRSDSNYSYYYYYRPAGRQSAGDRRSAGRQSAGNQHAQVWQDEDNRPTQVLQSAGNQHAQVRQIDENYNLKNENLRAVSLTPLPPVHGEPFKENGHSN